MVAMYHASLTSPWSALPQTQVFLARRAPSKRNIDEVNTSALPGMLVNAGLHAARAGTGSMFLDMSLRQWRTQGQPNTAGFLQCRDSGNSSLLERRRHI